ncbi:MAG: S23 ribosomal protein [Candidatus Magasanikbacteria bacterium GW2011_GWC2_37_14]|uniref:S23 ribosomal protein n=1 Tax=Candidatus Magasanikbacteria bacterium GW2011_GWC2_37_14 TaxID=1619046 RepID=A0A0G0IVP2_9BACT|nr:MAG: S23 ribosomal protein [Candidatus Magasanikbacteria bacterium GW2011_GWC2_37_14]
MTVIKTFKELLVWQKSHQLTLIIYKITNDYPKYEIFALTSQTRRASSSIPANIVEGFRRQSLKDSINFYNTADASLEELKYHLLLAKDLNYISIERYNYVLEKAEEVGKLLTGWLQSQRKFLNTK